MGSYVQEDVANIRDDATPGESVTLLVGVTEGAMADVKERAREAGATSVRELPFNSLQVTLPETSVGTICEIPSVESVELDEGMEVLSGN